MNDRFFTYGPNYGALTHFHQLPALLNKHGVSALAFQQLRMADKPELTYILLRAMLEQDLLGVPKAMKGMVVKRLHRCHVAARRWASLPVNHTHALLSAVADFDNRKENSQRDAMRRLVVALIDENGLYDEDGVVKAKLQGTFSYDTYDLWQDRLDNFFTLDCASCGHSEIIKKPWEWATSGGAALAPEDVPEMLEQACECAGFDPLSGPYVRCIRCDWTQRAKIGEAVSLPDDEGDDIDDLEEQWTDYVEHLGTLVEALVEHAKQHGLPAPYRLKVIANRIRWDGATGYTDCEVDGKALADKLKVDSDFSISSGKLWLEPDGTGMLTCSLAHHDATGFMEVVPQWLCELADRDTDDDALIEADQVPACSTWLPMIANTLLCGKGMPFAFTSKFAFKMVSRTHLITALEWMQKQLDWDDEVLELEGVWAVQIAGNLLMKQMCYLIRTTVSDVEGYALAQTAQQLRAVIDTFLVEKQNFPEQ